MLQDAFKIIEFIRIAGGDARLVGGAVRDYLLDIPLKDIDMATTLEPDEVIQCLEGQGLKVVPTGIDFGTVTAVFNKKPYEITTLRKDLNCDGRHAKVVYTKDWVEDASRRDFTFNALYMDVEGDIYDYFDGQTDLKNGEVKFIGDAEERINEDYLRILRMFRFFTYYGNGEILGKQLEVCRLLACNLKQISVERIWLELAKILSHENPSVSLKLMNECDILQQIYDCDAGYSEAIKALEKFYSLKKENIATTVLSILMNIDSQDKAKKISEHLKLSKKERTQLISLSNSRDIDFSDDFSVRKSIRLNGKEGFREFLYLNYALSRITAEELKNLTSKTEDFLIHEFPLRGQDLLNSGIKNRKNFGKYLAYAEEHWEKNNYNLSKKELLLCIGSYIEHEIDVR